MVVKTIHTMKPKKKKKKEATPVGLCMNSEISGGECCAE